jgi:hypothetical protein
VPPVTARRVSLTFRRLDAKVAAAAAAQSAAAAAAHVSKGDAKRRAKVAAKDAKKNLKSERRLAAAAADASAGAAISTDKSTDKASGAKSTPVPAAMLRLLAALPRHGRSPTGGGNFDGATPLPEPDPSAESVVRMPLVERHHVQWLYDAIAPQWHGTRYRTWPRVVAFVEQLAPGTLVCDAGCGNGKNLPACNAYRTSATAAATAEAAEEGDAGGAPSAADSGSRGNSNSSSSSNTRSSIGSSSSRSSSSSSSSTSSSTSSTSSSSTCSRRGWGLGSDFSVELVKIVALERGLDAIVADSLALPYRTG